MTLEELELIRKLTGQSGDEQLSAPQLAPVVPYQERASEYTRKASQLEDQAQTPYPRPQSTKDYLVESARAAIENFGRYGAPGGYYGQEEQRRKEFTDAQQSRLDQAKQYRALSLQEAQAGDLVQNRQDTLDETRRLRSVEERRQSLAEQQAKRPIRTETSPGATESFHDPNTAAVIGERYTAPNKVSNELDHRDEVQAKDNHTIRHYFPKGSPENVVYSADLGETKRDPNLGSTAFIPIIDPNTNEYKGGFSPGLNKYVPAPPQVQGNVTRPQAPGLTEKVADIEKAYSNIVDLETKVKPEFIGPYVGAWEESKVNGLGKYIPGTQSAEGFADFSALNANLKNYMIKLTTGAAVRKDEEARILNEVPTAQERDFATWQAKYQLMRRNADMLMNRIKQMNSMGNPQQPQAPVGGASDAIRKRLGLPPKGQ